MIRGGYAILLVLLIGIILLPLLIRPSHLLYPRVGQATDLTITHWPAVAFNVRSLRHDGQLPLWRTTIASGGPWLANPQSWLLYPPAWLFFLMPINLTFNLLLVAHLLLAGLATYVFGRLAVGLRPPSAALAGLGYAVAPWVSGHLAGGHVNIVLALAWLPVALVAIHQAVTKARVGSALLTGVAWAAALLNHLQMAAFTMALTLAWALWLLLSRKSKDSNRPLPVWRSIGLLLLVPVVAILLASALLLPLAQALPYLNRASMTLEDAGVHSLPWTHLITAIIPTYGGDPEQVAYLGLPVVLLALVGLVLKRDRIAWFLALVAGAAALFALGTHAPLFPTLFRWIPGLGLLRVPPRAWVLVAFGTALLAGRGLDALLSLTLTRASRRRVAVISTAALGVGLALAAGLLLLYRPAPPAAWVIAALVPLTAAAVLLRVRGRLRPDFFAVAILILAAFDLAVVRAAWTEMRAPADAFTWGQEVASYLAQQDGPFRSYSPSYSLPQHTALQHHLFLADGVDPIQLAHYASFLALAGGYDVAGYSPTLPPVLDDASAHPDSARLGLLNVAYVTSSFPIEAQGLVLEQQVAGTYIYRNQEVLPPAFVLPYDQVPAADELWLELPIDLEPARIVKYTPNRIVVEAILEAPGLLVLSEVWYPGWRAWAGSQEVPILRVEGVLRGIGLTAGTHRVELRFGPSTVWLGLAVSGGTTLLLLGYATSHLRKQP